MSKTRPPEASYPFARAVSDRMEEKGIGVRGLAEALQTSPGYISDIARGKRHCNRSAAFRVKLAEALGFKPDKLHRLAARQKVLADKRSARASKAATR